MEDVGSLQEALRIKFSRTHMTKCRRRRALWRARPLNVVAALVEERCTDTDTVESMRRCRSKVLMPPTRCTGICSDRRTWSSHQPPSSSQPSAHNPTSTHLRRPLLTRRSDLPLHNQIHISFTSPAQDETVDCSASRKWRRK